MKKMLSFVLAFALIMANMNTAFAAEPEDSTGTELVKHTIEITLEPGEEDDGIMPLRYDEYDPTVLRGNTIKTDKFYSEYRYMAFEAYATDIYGNIVNGEIIINLRDYTSDGLVGDMYLSINGKPDKNDWIDGGRGWYYFTIYNKSNSHVNLNLVYYSWA